MSIERRPDQIAVAHLSADPQLSLDLESLLTLAAVQPTNIVLNFADVRYITSTHIAMLLKLRKLTLAGERRLILCAVDSQVWSVFTVTGLDKIYEFTDTLPAALTMFQAT